MSSQLPLLKPLIHPKIQSEESPVFYLSRLAVINQYNRAEWFANSEISKNLSAAAHTLINILDNTPWTGYNPETNIHQMLLSTDRNHLSCNTVKFCPKCLTEKGYTKTIWHLKVSFSCLEHKTWLIDECPACKEQLSPSRLKMFKCICGHDLRNVSSQSVSTEVKQLQRFIENKPEKIKILHQLLPQNHNLEINERVDLIIFFSKWFYNIERKQVNKYSVFRKMSIAKNIFEQVALILFGEEQGFRDFLKNIHQQRGEECFKKLYQQLYSVLRQNCFSKYKDLLERYINESWNSPLSKKNSLFKTSTLEEHPWIPFRRACVDLNIHKSTLRRLVRKRRIRYQIENKESRVFIHIYKPDLINYIYRIRDKICSTEARDILGLTKLQFSQLTAEDVFEYAHAPNENHQSWLFSKSEIRGFKSKYTSKLKSLDGKFWSLSQVLKCFSSRLDKPLVTILSAIDKGALIPVSKIRNSKGIRGIQFAKSEFRIWYDQHKRGRTLYSIPHTAKIIGISQEFVYQLVRENCLPTIKQRDKKISWVNYACIESFNQKYVVLSKLSRKIKINSKVLISHFDRKGIKSVSDLNGVTFKQRLYLRDSLKALTLTSEFV